MIDALYAEHQRARGGGWTDWSAAAFDQRGLAISNTLERLQLSGAAAEPDAQARLEAMLLARELRLEREAIDYRLHAFPVNQLMGVPNQTTDGLRIPFFLTTQHPLDTIADAEALIELVVQSEGHLRQVAAALRDGARLGITPPREALLATRRVIHDSVRGIPVTAARGPHPIYERFTRWASSFEGAAAALPDAADRLAAALAGPLLRGYAAIDGAVDEMLARGRASFGVWDLPAGPAFYQHCLERWSGTSTAADDLHRLGLDEIARIQAEIRPRLPDRDRNANLRDIAERMRRDIDACFPTTAAGVAAYIDRARELTRLVGERLGRIISWRARTALEIRAVEAARQSGSLYAEFYPGAADGTRSSVYYVNGADMTRLPRSELAALTFHEGIPGHHLQICATQERDDLASFRRRPFLYESYAEGWAMYAEQLGCELLEDELLPQEQLGCLTRRLWMAARLAVDTGIHVRRWTRAEALHFFAANTFAPPGMIEQEVDRLSVWPAQATAYHVGYLAFRRLRDGRVGASGGMEPVRSFHDRLFRAGPVPVEMLPMALDQTP